MFIYDLIIAPIEMIVGWVFYFFMNKFHGFGVIGAIFGVSNKFSGFATLQYC